MWSSNMQHDIGITSVKHNCPIKGFDLGVLDFQIGLSRWKEVCTQGMNYKLKLKVRFAS